MKAKTIFFIGAGLGLLWIARNATKNATAAIKATQTQDVLALQGIHGIDGIGKTLKKIKHKAVATVKSTVSKIAQNPIAQKVVAAGALSLPVSAALSPLLIGNKNFRKNTLPIYGVEAAVTAGAGILAASPAIAAALGVGTGTAGAATVGAGGAGAALTSALTTAAVGEGANLVSQAINSDGSGDSGTDAYGDTSDTAFAQQNEDQTASSNDSQPSWFASIVADLNHFYDPNTPGPATVAGLGYVVNLPKRRQLFQAKQRVVNIPIQRMTPAQRIQLRLMNPGK